MVSKFNLYELLQDGFSEIRVSSNLYYSIILHFVFPILIGLLFVFLNIQFDNDIVSNIISSISIFSGLLFSVIFIVTENYSKRKQLVGNNPNDEAKSYIERYKDFTKQITTLILFSIAIAIISIIFLLLYLFIDKSNAGEYRFWSEIIKIFNLSNDAFKSFKYLVLTLLQIFSFTFLFNYLLAIIILIKEVYAMVFDSINLDV